VRIQLLSDLHLESEAFDPEPAPGAELLVLAGDIDRDWHGYARFAGWPVPVLVVAGNHEFDGRELDQAWPALRDRCAALGFALLERESVVLRGADGRRVRFLGTVRWCDFELFGGPGTTAHARALRAASYFQRLMKATRGGAPFDAEAVRAEGRRCGDWLAQALAADPDAAAGAGADPDTDPASGPAWDATVVVTHFGPSAASVDPRFGRQPSSASFCNADDALLPGADLWLHGHVHCRHDYTVCHAGGRRTRVVCQSRGNASKGEAAGFDPLRVIEA
jgi:hypothetical protein